MRLHSGSSQLSCIVVFVILLSTSGSVFSQVTSTFTTDDEGWTFLNASSVTVVPNYSNSGGNPAGFVSLTYASTTSSTLQRWVAPAKFLGNHAARSLGQNLKFDLQQSVAGTNSISSGDVRISTSGLILVYSLPAKPAVAPAWSSYELRLDETQGWRVSSTTGTLATRAQVIRVLSNITEMEIRGTYVTNAAYTSALDNVVMEQIPLGTAPVITSFSPVSGKPGTSVTVTGTGFDPDAADNMVYFHNMIAGTITAASATQITVTVPQGAVHGPLHVLNKTTGRHVRSSKPFQPVFDNGGRIIRASLMPRIDIPLTTQAGNGVTGIAAADLDGDGFTDLIVGQQMNKVSVFRHLGTTGTISGAMFSAPTDLTGAGNQNGLSTTDLDGDGKVDILAAYSDGFAFSFQYFRNTSTPGNISFDAGVRTPGTAYSGMLSAVIDVDGDGRPDLVGQHRNGSAALDLWIAQNISSPGNIEFAYPNNFFGNALDAGDGVTFGDFNTDNKPDLIVRYSFGGLIAIIENTSTPGNFSFGTPDPITRSSYGGIAIHDFNADGKLDFALKHGGSNQDIVVKLNNHTTGSLTAADFATEVTFNNDQLFYGGLSLSDINGDGKPDFLVTDGGNLSIYENNTQGTDFNSTSLITGYLFEGAGNSTYPTTPISADLNHDSRPDIIVGIDNLSPPRIGIYENVNERAPRISLTTVSPLKGEVGSTVTITGNDFSATPSENRVRFGAVEATVLTATVNQLTVRVPAGASIGPVSVTRDQLTSFYHLPFIPTFSNGVSFDGSHFGTPVAFTLTGADYDVEVADLNRDGKPDVVAEGAALDSYSFRNTHTAGAISITSLTPDDTTAANAQNPRLKDIDGDGLVDLLTISGVYRNTSTGSEISFQSPESPASGGNHDFGDFNLDGKIDVVTVNGTSAVVFENRTTRGPLTSNPNFGSFSSAFNLAKPGANGGAATADFDNDGLIDIANTNSGTDNVSIWKNNGASRIAVSQFTLLPPITVGDNPNRIYSGDLDVDGKVDLFLYHATSLFITILHNQSTPGNISFNRVDIPITGSVANTGTISDLDGDGKPELLITQEISNRFSIFKNVSVPGVITAASFQAPFHTTVTAPRGITTGDLNLDGKPEIVLTRTGQLLVYENLVPIVTISFPLQPQNAVICENGNTTFSVTATGDTNLTYQWQIDNTGFTDLTNAGVYTGVNTSTLTITNAPATLNNKVYRCVVKGDNSSNTPSAGATLTVNGLPVLASPTPSVCSDAAINLNLAASGPVSAATYSVTSRTVATGLTSATGNISVPSSGLASNALANESFANITAGSLQVSYQVNGVSSNGCVGSPVTINVTILPKPVMLPATSAICSGEDSGITLAADAASVAATGYNFISVTVPPGVNADAGNAVVSNGVSAAVLSGDSFNNNTNSPASVIYTVRPVSAAACVGNSQTVTLTVNPLPVMNPNLDFTTCSGGSIGLQLLTGQSSVAAANFTMNSVTASAGLTPAGSNKLPASGLTASSLATDSYLNTTNGLLTVTYSVTPVSAAGCVGLPSSIVVTINTTLCSNVPPVIDPASTQVKVQGLAEIDLLSLISDADNNLDPTSLIIVTQPASGAPATIINGILQIDYANTVFSGDDNVVISACDNTSACTTAIVRIEVIGDITVFNGVSPNGDQLNDIFTIEYIDFLDDTRNNRVTIYNRWGDLVWEGSNYDNESVYFAGIGKNGNELPNGTYFYKIEFPERPAVTGYLSLKK